MEKEHVPMHTKHILVHHMNKFKVGQFQKNQTHHIKKVRIINYFWWTYTHVGVYPTPSWSQAISSWSHSHQKGSTSSTFDKHMFKSVFNKNKMIWHCYLIFVMILPVSFWAWVTIALKVYYSLRNPSSLTYDLVFYFLKFYYIILFCFLFFLLALMTSSMNLVDLPSFILPKSFMTPRLIQNFWQLKRPSSIYLLTPSSSRTIVLSREVNLECIAHPLGFSTNWWWYISSGSQQISLPIHYPRIWGKKKLLYQFFHPWWCSWTSPCQPSIPFLRSYPCNMALVVMWTPVIGRFLSLVLFWIC